MTAWKTVERTVAAILGGVRSWQTDHDVLVVLPSPQGFGPTFREDQKPEVLMELHRLGLLGLVSVEVKHLKAPTVAQLEAFLAKNQEKIDRDIPHAVNALVVKRKAGRGAETPFLLVMPIALTESSRSNSQGEE
jgi:hypothetical protein